MYIKELEINNFGPFKGSQIIKFTENDSVIFIQGTYDENDKRSNQAGKSSFTESILYLLYGQTRKNTKEIDLIHKGTDEMYIAGTIVVDGQEIYIKRGRTKANKPILEIEGIKGKKSDKEKELLSIMGFDFSTFINTFYFEQNNVHTFMEATPTEKKRLLQSWFNLDKWKEYEDKAKKKVADRDSILKESQARRDSLNTQLGLLRVEGTEEEMNTGINKCQGMLKESSDRVIQLNIDLSKTVDVSSVNDNINKLNASIAKLNNDINTTANDEKKTLAKQQEALSKQTKLNEYKSKITVSSDSIKSKLDELQKQQLPHVESKSKLEAVLPEKRKLCDAISKFTGVCPVDKATCDKGSRIPDQKATLEKEITDITTSINGLVTTLNSLLVEEKNLQTTYREAKNIENTIASLANDSDPTVYDGNLTSLRNNLAILTKQKDDIQNQISDLQNQLKSLDTSARTGICNKLNDEKRLQDLLNGKIKQFNSQIGEIKKTLELQSSIKTQISNIEQQMIEQKKEYHRWAYIMSILGKDGIPSILIENSLSFIEEFANVILESITSGKTTIEFSTSKEVTTKETHCSICGSPYGKENNCEVCGFGFKRNKIKDEIDLKVFNSGNEISFALDSGGGKILISLALRLALSKLLSNKSKRCDFLVLDEVFASLDQVNRDTVSKMVFNALRNIMGIRQIFVITHCALNDYAYKTLKIIRHNGFSTISY